LGTEAQSPRSRQERSGREVEMVASSCR
jgi:hypothetical protein